MKLTKSYLRKVIKEELENISEEEQEVSDGAAATTDKTAQRAGVSAVKVADEVIDMMLQKASQLESRLGQLRSTQQRKLALARAVLIKIVEMDPNMIDKMIAQMSQAAK